MEMAKVTSKGQITIPVSIRRRLCINEGDNLLFIDRPEGVIMVNPDMLPGERGEQKETKAQKPKKTARAEVAADLSVAPQPAENAPAEVVAEVAEVAETPEPEKPAPAGDTSVLEEAPSPVIEHAKQGPQLQGLDLKELLNEIRSIGSNI